MFLEGMLMSRAKYESAMIEADERLMARNARTHKRMSCSFGGSWSNAYMY